MRMNPGDPRAGDDAAMARRLTWLGHATVLIELGGVRVLTDPLLRGRVAHLRRHVPVPEPPAALDAVLLSHLHRDHADRPSLRRLAPTTPVLAPAGAARTVRRLGVREVVGMQAGDRVPLASGAVLAVPADHDGRRSPLHPHVPALGFVVEEDGRRVYFAGDTDRFDAMADLGPLDAALVPIWGWGSSLGPGHLDPERAADVVALIRPRLVVPIHWATYLPFGYGAGHALLREPGRAFTAAMRARAPEVRVALLAPGETVQLA
jgi:L-ascorbate metabolism protein UlaG (beta-lactamase superfamily)